MWSQRRHIESCNADGEILNTSVITCQGGQGADHFGRGASASWLGAGHDKFLPLIVGKLGDSIANAFSLGPLPFDFLLIGLVIVLAYFVATEVAKW